MKLIIDIDEETYKMCRRLLGDADGIERAIANGTPYEERPQGEWMNKGIYQECSECFCGCMFTISDKIMNGGLNFCPNCGADMRGGRE